jgi:hypothetical protein
MSAINRLIIHPLKEARPDQERYEKQSQIALGSDPLSQTIVVMGMIASVTRIALQWCRGGIGLWLVKPLWGQHWRDCEYAADRYAARLGQGDELADFLETHEDALTVHQGRRGGEPETRIQLDHLLPSPASATNTRARWRLATTGTRLYPPPVTSEPMKAWHMAEGQKGRRLVAGDLREDNRVVAVLAWHFEPGSASGGHRPHLITAAAVRQDVEDFAVRAEYLLALWLLTCVMCAIDRRTIRSGRVGLVLDGGIALSPSELVSFGFQRGRKREGYRGDYYTLPA